MFKTIDNLEDYVFGTGLTAGLAPITGDAGGEVDPEMSFEEFVDIIEIYLDGEHEESKHLDMRALRTEFKSKKCLRALYSEFKDRQGE